MFNIHQIFINELREKKHFVTNTIVQNIELKDLNQEAVDLASAIAKNFEELGI